MIRKVKGGYKVLSEKGKNLGGPYPSKEQAKKRLADVEKFKHMNKSELCQLCGKCCKCMILPVVKPLQKSLMIDWLDVRDCRVIGEANDIMYVEVKTPCPFLIKSSGKFNCEIYDNRPEGCRVFDGSKYEWLDCLWKYMEDSDDMRKSIQITTIDEEFEKARTRGAKDIKKRKKRYSSKGLDPDSFNYYRNQGHSAISAIQLARRSYGQTKLGLHGKELDSYVAKYKTENINKAARAPGKIGMRKFVGRSERKRQAKRERVRKETEKRSDIQAYGFTMGED